MSVRTPFPRLPTVLGGAISVLVALLAVALLIIWAIRFHEQQVFGRELITKAASGEFGLVNAYFAKGGDPDLKDRTGVSLAYYATTFERIDILEILSAKGADFRDSPPGFEDVLKQAINTQNRVAVALLIGSGQWDSISISDVAVYVHSAELHNERFRDVVKEAFANRQMGETESKNGESQ